MDEVRGLAALLPFWILIGGALWIGSTAWFDPEVRRARTDERRTDAYGRPIDPPL